MRRQPITFVAPPVFAIALVAFLATPSAQTLGQREHFSASAIDINNGQTGRVEISITRWSTPAEREALLTTLVKEGSQEHLEKLRDMRSVGRISSPGSIGYDLKYAEQQKRPDGGRVIVMATDRPMSFWEMIKQPRSADYPLTWVQLNLGPDNTGDGRLAVAARFFADRPNRPIEVEHFEIQPIRLQNVTARVD
jgi:hypothetical protein